MGLFDAVGDAFSGAAKFVGNAAEAAVGAAGDAAQAAVGLAGGAAQTAVGLAGTAASVALTGPALLASTLVDGFETAAPAAGRFAEKFNRNALQEVSYAANFASVNTGETLEEKLFNILSKLEEKLNGAVDGLSQIKEGDQSGLQKAMFEIQKMQNMMKQIFETITNVQKSKDDQKESIIRNFV